jgi:hypothetical protein
MSLLVLFFAVLLFYVVVNSTIIFNTKYLLSLIFCLFLHVITFYKDYYIPLFSPNLIVKIIEVVFYFLGLLGVLIIYIKWFLQKRNKKNIDYLKLIWVVIFLLSYTYTNLTYRSKSSEDGIIFFAGFKTLFNYTFLVQLIYTLFLFCIALFFAKKKLTKLT